jgi:zinc finger SWIM domain-containing protein 3
METQTCSCRQWQFNGYPCSHSLAIILAQGRDPQTYAKPFFTLDAHRQTYSNALFQPLAGDYSQPLNYTVSEEDSDAVDSSSESFQEETNVILPPNTRRPPGRPQKRRIRTQSERDRDLNTARRTQRCSQCGGTRHSKRTCKEPITL